MTIARLKFQRRRGYVLFTVLIFLLIVSILLGGMATLMVSDLSIGKTEANYENSLPVAEAGINYELRKISNGTAADQKNATAPYGTTYATTAGTFQVYVTQRGSGGAETTPWTAGQNLYIYSTGTVNGVSRTVKVAVTPYSSAATGNYALYGMTSGTINTTPTIVNGDVGTNGQFTFNNHPTISGNIIFNGASAGWQNPPSGSYSVVHNANALSWPTVETLAVTAFGSTGLTYVASHNDNALASPAIANPNLVANSNQTFVGKAGGANYYLTNLTLNGSSLIYFNNSAGPITIWIGPSGASTTVNFSAGTATVKQTTDPTKSVKIYIATSSDIAINGNVELDAGIYMINNSGSGHVIFNGNASIYGMIMSNGFVFNSSPTIYNVQGYFAPTGSGAVYYGIVQPYQEIGSIY